MIIYFCPSKNRPSQLLTLCKSIEKRHLGDEYEIWVYFDYKEKQYEVGYEKIVPFLKNTKLLPSKNVIDDFTHCIENSTTDYVTILTDDTYFYKPYYLSERLLKQHLTDDVLCLNMRYGVNITHQHIPLNLKHPYVFSYSLQEYLRKWNWVDVGKSYCAGFPWAMDAYSYRKEDTLLTLRGKFRNHRDREIAINGDNMWHKRPNMIGYIVGPAVNIPINCVQEPKMEHATYYDFDENFLNKILLCGYYIDYRIDKVICSHQEYNIKIQELPYGF